MEIVLIVLLIIIVTALVVANLPGLRARAATRRPRSRGGDRIAPASDQTGAMHHVPDDDDVRMRAQAHREAAVAHQGQAEDLSGRPGPAGTRARR